MTLLNPLTKSIIHIFKSLFEGFFAIFTSILKKCTKIQFTETGRFKKRYLDKITLGNEYDVQRMLFSLIRPIFPEARIEIYADGGYKGYRYDIYFDDYQSLENHDKHIETFVIQPILI